MEDIVKLKLQELTNSLEGIEKLYEEKLKQLKQLDNSLAQIRNQMQVIKVSKSTCETLIAEYEDREVHLNE